MNVKVAYQTIIWGPYIRDLESVLDIIQHAGYQGVEFAQRPDRIHMLGSPRPVTIDKLLALLSKRMLALVGLAGGTLYERMSFCGDFRPVYQYVEYLDDYEAARATSHTNPFTLALHPHYHKRLQYLHEAAEMLDRHPQLKWLPDTAHLYIAGEDPLEALRLAPDRLLAVHLKDWSPAYGTSHYRYSRGFTELGEGDVPLIEVLDQLKKQGMPEWLVVEQDGTRTTPLRSALESAHWLYESGIFQIKPPPASESNTDTVPIMRPEGINSEADRSFLAEIVRASSQEIPKCYYDILTAIQRLILCPASLWAYNATHNVMTLLAANPEDPSIWKDYQYIEAGGTLNEVAVERQAVSRFDLMADQPAAQYGRDDAQFGRSNLRDQLGFRYVVSIPIVSPSHSNYVRMILNLYPDDDLPSWTDNDLFLLGMDIASATNIALDDKCASAAAETNFYSGMTVDAMTFLKHVAYRIKKAVSCEGVSIFLVSSDGDRLEEAVTTGTKRTDLDPKNDWGDTPNEERYYSKGEGCTGAVWERKESLLVPDARALPEWKGKSTEVVEDTDRFAMLFTLLAKGDKVFGVVRCRNKSKDEHGRVHMFSNDDLAIIDAINQAAVPHLEVLLGEERSTNAVARLHHEVRQALALVRGAIDLTQTELEDSGKKPEKIFRQDYLGDALSWSVLIGRLLDNAKLSGIGQEQLELRAERCLIAKDIIAPTVRQMRML